ncbi:histidine kinase [Oscillospiraceae bacterium HV4-5-C5C]|nr:histidine kinase [Oscillospiraceae bacterium HV4-5-C5C]
MLILLSTIVLLGVELVSFLVIQVYEKDTVQIYQQSLDYYSAYWDRTFSTIDTALLNLANADSRDNSYWQVCYTENQLTRETEKTILAERLSTIARNQGNTIITFAYIPDRETFIKSQNQLVNYDKRAELIAQIKAYTKTLPLINSETWQDISYDGEEYFIHAYAVETGYVGAIINVKAIFSDLMSDSDTVSLIKYDSDDMRAIYQTEIYDADTTDTDQIFNLDMSKIHGDLSVYVQTERLLGSRTLFILLPLGTLLAGLALLVWNIYFQMKHVHKPINQLSQAMETFSSGELSVRLPEEKLDRGMRVLFSSFNAMAAQIQHLKIDVYEEKIEREKIESNYLRVQIRPHFYTNILNLISGLAQIKDYASIQQLAATTAAYFRYLLGEKGSFVPLKEELRCVESYFQIQQIRYQDILEYSLTVMPGLENQLILPMAIQTFAENCIKHNITLVPVLRIAIEICIDQKQLRISIRDNGNGFPAETLEKIQTGAKLSEDGEHIGITNVLQRMQLFYGNAAHLSISSQRGMSNIELSFPIIE